MSHDGESNESGAESNESCCVTEEEIVALAEARLQTSGLGLIEKAIMEKEDDEFEDCPVITDTFLARVNTLHTD